MSERKVRQRTDQKTIGQPIAQGEYHVGDSAEHPAGNKPLISKRSRRRHNFDAGELAVIDVGKGKDIEVHRSEYGHKQERDRSVGYEPPFDALPPATEGVKQRGHAFEEQYNNYS